MRCSNCANNSLLSSAAKYEHRSSTTRIEVGIESLRTLHSRSQEEVVSRFHQTSQQMASMLQVQNDILSAVTSRHQSRRTEIALDESIGGDQSYSTYTESSGADLQYSRLTNREVLPPSSIIVNNLASHSGVPKSSDDGEDKCPIALTTSTIGVTLRDRNVCGVSCTCDCHSSAKIRFPSFFSRYFGSLLIGYTGNPVLNSRCSEADCRRQHSHSLVIMYCFPAWFLARTIQVLLHGNSAGDLTLSISTRRRVMDYNLVQLVTLYSWTGEVDAMKVLFHKRTIWPNDQVSRFGQTALHVSCHSMVYPPALGH